MAKISPKLFELRKDPVDDRDFPLTMVQPRLSKAQLADVSRIDWTNEMSPVKDQKDLGACVGFAVSAMKEFQEQKEHAAEVAAGKQDHRDEKYYDLSEQWIYYMAKMIDTWPGEEGTSIRFAMKVLNQIGVPCEKAWPYDDHVRGNPKSWAHLVARWNSIGSYARIETLEELKQGLLKSPVPFGMACFEEIFYVGDTGIVPLPAQPQ